MTSFISSRDDIGRWFDDELLNLRLRHALCRFQKAYLHHREREKVNRSSANTEHPETSVEKEQTESEKREEKQAAAAKQEATGERGGWPCQGDLGGNPDFAVCQEPDTSTIHTKHNESQIRRTMKIKVRKPTSITTSRGQRSKGITG